MTVRIAPSILAADFSALGEEIATAERGGADLIHVDVMDGHFVPNITIGPPVIRAIKRVTSLPLDVHLMIADPARYLTTFADAGADFLSVHVEATPHLHKTLTEIKKLGVQAGVALNPSTPESVLNEIATEVDFILVMSVNPGFGGQKFIPHTLTKIVAIQDILEKAKNEVPIEVDGGISQSNAGDVVAAGADMLVAGSAIFGSPDPSQAIEVLRMAGSAGLPQRERKKT
ncbi:MAG TPA: ribulose-phosphate 3-epimerase [Acidobacteria bacterium]|jgi:ribulose-phosphate 3-epimerase|nr:ribulose-phosphate 3-epimerase [Acidobacteriota bacterium]